VLIVTLLGEELERLLGHLRELQLAVTQFLRPGAEGGAFADVLGAEPPASVLEWFSWCNGVRSEQGQVQDDVNIIPGYNPISVEEAVRLKPSYAGDPVLGENWIPLLDSAGGDIYAAVWNGSENAAVAGVLAGELTEIEFPSILDMVRYFNACYQRGAFYVDGRWLAMNADSSALVYDEMFTG
jgi:hypothetical protein